MEIDKNKHSGNTVEDRKGREELCPCIGGLVSRPLPILPRGGGGRDKGYSNRTARQQHTHWSRDAVLLTPISVDTSPRRRDALKGSSS